MSVSQSDGTGDEAEFFFNCFFSSIWHDSSILQLARTVSFEGQSWSLSKLDCKYSRSNFINNDNVSLPFEILSVASEKSKNAEIGLSKVSPITNFGGCLA